MVPYHPNSCGQRRCDNILNMVLGASVEGISDELMLCVWEITGVAVNGIYNKILKNREGVG